MNKHKIRYRESDVEEVFQALISNWDELNDFYKEKVIDSYSDTEERLAYIDMGDVAMFILDKKRKAQTEKFESFFENVEEVLIYGDHYVKELIVIGLFEGIQNIGGIEIDYHRSFDQWLKLNSLKVWQELIDFWETTEWKKTAESEKIWKVKPPRK